MKQKYLQNKWRETPRIPTVIRVDYHTRERFFMDFAENLSTGGMFITTQSPLEPGTQLNLEFLLPEYNYPIRVKAEVKWIRTSFVSNNQRHGMGVEFKNLSDNAKNKISAFMKKLKQSS